MQSININTDTIISNKTDEENKQNIEPIVLQNINGVYACTHNANLETTFNFQQDNLKNHLVILYFYPKDNTPGCTTQASDFRDAHNILIEKNVIVLGVSRDNLKSHMNFTQKFNLPFNLICDTEEQLCAQFNVIKPKNMYGKMVRGIQRSTFIYDIEGRLIHSLRNVKASNHVEDLLNIIDAHGV